MMKISPFILSFKQEQLMILTVLVGQYFAEYCPTLRLKRSTRGYGQQRVRHREPRTFATFDPISHEIITLPYQFMRKEFRNQIMTYDVYVLDGVDDGRHFVAINIFNTRIVPGSGRIYYSQGQFTVDPSGNTLITTPSPNPASQTVSMCDNNIFEWLADVGISFKLIKHGYGGKESVVCVVESKRSLKVRLTSIESCSTPDALWALS